MLVPWWVQEREGEEPTPMEKWLHFCQIVRASTSTSVLYTIEKVVAFQDINPFVFKHYLVILMEHISIIQTDGSIFQCVQIWK